MADKILLENGTDRILLEDGTSLLEMEAANAYVLTADSATFSITPNAVGLNAARKVTATSSSFAITPTATTLKRANQLTATASSYAITPTVPSIKRANKLAAVAASFAISTQLAGLTVANKIPITASSFALTPNLASLRAARYLQAQAPLRTPQLSVEGVSDTELLLSWALVSVPTGLAVQGVDDTELLLSWNAAEDVADFNVSTNEATFVKGYTLSVDTASYDITVHDARLFKTPAALIAEPPLTVPINFTATNDASGMDAVINLAWQQGHGLLITPNDAGLSVARQLHAETASYVITPHAITFPSGVILTAQSAVYTLTPNDAGLSVQRTLSAQTGTYSFTPNAVQFYNTRSLNAQSSSFSLTPNAANLIYTPISDFTLNAESATFSFTPNAVGLLRTRVMVAESATYVFTTYGATIFTGTGEVIDEPLFINLNTGRTFINANSGVVTVNLTTGRTFIDLE